MTWPPDIANELPAPRDDEPSSLRQDIADELADHLQSSFVGELHRTPDQAQAQQHVLDRFGDPRRVARQLWFDAMKETIMSQRVTITALVVTAVACLGSTGLSWMLVQQSREANQALLEQAKDARLMARDLMTQNENANSKMLDRLAALAAPAPAPTAAPKSMEWNPVKIRLVKDEAGGPPADGYEVRLYGNLLDTSKQIEIARKSGADGLADMGLLRPGKHELRIRTPWSESRETTTVTVLPGQEFVEEVVCPGADREQASISISFNWPQDLRDRKPWAVLQCYQQWRKIGTTVWGEQRDREFAVFDPEGQMVSQPIDQQRLNPDNHSGLLSFGRQRNRAEFAGLFFDEDKLAPWYYGPATSAAPRTKPLVKEPHGLRPFHFQYLAASGRPEWRLPAGRYVVSAILVAEHPANDADTPMQAVDVIGGLIRNHDSNPLRQYGYGNFAEPFSEWLDHETERETPSGSRERNAMIQAAQPQFEVAPGNANRVRLPVYPRLVENVWAFLEFTK